MIHIVTVFTTTTCQPCKTAIKRLDSLGIHNEAILLDREPAVLAEIKKRLGRETISTPIFEVDGKLHEGMHSLAAVIALATEAL